MRKFLYLLLLVCFIPIAAMAQKDLQVGRILDGHYKKNPAVTEVEIMGERLREYGLTYYHSFTVKGDQKIMEEVRAAFLADEPKAVDKDVTNVGGRLSTGMYRLEFDGVVNRFLFFKDMRLSPSKKQNAVMVIYMEGNITLKTLQRIFKNK